MRAASSTDQGPNFAFEVPTRLVGAFASDALGLRWSPLSPIAFAAGSHEPGVSLSELGALVIDARAERAMTALVQPDAVLRVSTADAAGALATLAWCPLPEGAGFVSASVPREGVLAVRHFERALDAAAWHAPAITAPATDAPPALLPRDWPLDAVIETLHAIDRYRRAYAEAMLGHRPLGEPVLAGRDLLTTMHEALASDDLRWLLPAFMRLTPGVASHAPEPAPVHIGRLVSAGILRPPTVTTSGPEFTFGDAGHALGLEFARSWWSASGIELTVALSDGARVLHRSFLATTRHANHRFTPTDAPDGGVTVQHEALSRAQMTEQLALLLGTATAVTMIAAAATCRACGAAVVLGEGLCRNCGAVLGAP